MNMIEVKNRKDVKIRGSTIAWGIKTSIKDSKKSPDFIYHKGDFGKRTNDHRCLMKHQT